MPRKDPAILIDLVDIRRSKPPNILYFLFFFLVGLPGWRNQAMADRPRQHQRRQPDPIEQDETPGGIH